METLDADGVLHRYSGDGHKAVHAEHGEGAQIGLDARTAAGVGAGDGHHPQRCLARWG